MALRRTTTVAPTPPETAPPPPAAPRRPPRCGAGLERLAPYIFVAPLLAVFALFYLWPALVTVLSSFFRWGLLRPWSPVEPARWRFVGLENYTEHPDRPQLLERRAQHGHLAGRVPAAGGRRSRCWCPSSSGTPTRAGTVFRTVFILPMTISLAAAGMIWSFIYNVDPQIGVLNAVLDRLGILGADWRLGPLELHPGAWLSNPGVLHLGFADIRLTNLVLVIPAFWAFTGFGVITLTAGLTAVPYELVEAAKVDGANAWQAARHILVPALRRPLVVVGVVSVIFALRTFDIVYVMTGGGPAQDTMVLALLLWQQAFAFLDTPQGGQATAIAVLMSAVLVAGLLPLPAAADRGQVPMTAVGRSRWTTFLLYGSLTVLGHRVAGADAQRRSMTSTLPLSQTRQGWWNLSPADLTFGNFARAWDQGLSQIRRQQLHHHHPGGGADRGGRLARRLRLRPDGLPASRRRPTSCSSPR